MSDDLGTGDDTGTDDASEDGDSASDDPLAWTALDTETVHDSPDFAVVRETVRLHDGTRTDFEHVHEPPAVVILPITPDDRVVVIKEWREAVERVNRGLPAGTVESSDADIHAAARRELEEETGHVADEIEHRLTVEPTNGLADSVHHHVVARDCRPTGERDLDADESIRVETTTLQELLDALAAGDLRDGRSALGVLSHARFADE